MDFINSINKKKLPLVKFVICIIVGDDNFLCIRAQKKFGFRVFDEMHHRGPLFN